MMIITRDESKPWKCQVKRGGQWSRWSLSQGGLILGLPSSSIISLLYLPRQRWIHCKSTWGRSLKEHIYWLHLDHRALCGFGPEALWGLNHLQFGSRTEFRHSPSPKPADQFHLHSYIGPSFSTDHNDAISARIAFPNSCPSLPTYHRREWLKLPLSTVHKIKFTARSFSKGIQFLLRDLRNLTKQIGVLTDIWLTDTLLVMGKWEEFGVNRYPPIRLASSYHPQVYIACSSRFQ